MIERSRPVFFKPFACFALLGAALSSGSAQVADIIVNDGGTLTVNTTVTLPDNGKVEVKSGGQSHVPDGGVVDGDVTVDAFGTLTFCGTITGTLLNSGDVISDCGSSGTVEGDMTNDGTFSMTRNTSLNVNGTLSNTGLLDIITGSTLSAGVFTNTGIVWDSEQASQDTTIVINGNSAEISIFARSSHFYQLQSRNDLLTGDWTTIGARQTGPVALQFVDTDALLSTDKNFYRLLITDD